MKARKEYEAQLVRIGEDAYRGATVETIRDGLWLVRARHYNTYVVDLPNGALLVYGQIDAVLFEGYHANRDASDADKLRMKANWAANSDVDYIASKVASSMRDSIRTVDLEIAAADLTDMEQDEISGCGEDAETVARLGEEAVLDKRVLRRLKAIREARDRVVNDGNIESAREEICENVDDGWEVAGSIGQVVASHLFYARAALRVFIAYLDAQRQAA